MLPIYKDENKQKEASIWPYFEYLVKYLSLILSQVSLSLRSNMNRDDDDDEPIMGSIQN